MDSTSDESNSTTFTKSKLSKSYSISPKPEPDIGDNIIHKLFNREVSTNQNILIIRRSLLNLLFLSKYGLKVLN